MTKQEAKMWQHALLKTSFDLQGEGDVDGADFIDELWYQILEFSDNEPIQRKPY